MTSTTRVQIRGKNWSKTTTIDAAKYEAMSKAILASLTLTPITFTALVQRVSARLSDFQGSISWYAITCARELEVQGKLVRQEKPVRYLKAGSSSTRSSPGRASTANGAA